MPVLKQKQSMKIADPGPPRGFKRSRAEGGFALVEVLIGLVILGVVVAAVFATLGSAFNTASMSRDNLRATQILVEAMEVVRLHGWDEIIDPAFGPKQFTSYADPSGATNAAGRGTLFLGTIELTPGPADVGYKDDMRTVTIDLSWKTGRLQRHRRLVTYVSRNGLQNYIY
jgi:prepilin-type N-terminal cleavage/methylation domain-containing protein